MPTLAVTKAQATGNDFVLLDNLSGFEHDYPALARHLCDRHFGVGADGLLVLLPPADDTDVTMRIFNADGSEAEHCGNGVRCVARYLALERGITQTGHDATTMTIGTPSGVVTARLLAGDHVRVEMGRPAVAAQGAQFEVGGASVESRDVSMGNPHCVIFVERDLADIDLAAFADAVERTGRYPEGVNVEIARMMNGVAQMRVRERGVGETLGCGTGACAVAAAAIATRRAASPVSVTQPGGTVTVAWLAPDGIALLEGPAQIVFRTIVEVPGRLAADVRLAATR